MIYTSTCLQVYCKETFKWITNNNLINNHDILLYTLITILLYLIVDRLYFSPSVQCSEIIKLEIFFNDIFLLKIKKNVIFLLLCQYFRKEHSYSLISFGNFANIPNGNIKGLLNKLFKNKITQYIQNVSLILLKFYFYCESLLERNTWSLIKLNDSSNKNIKTSSIKKNS